MNPRLLATFYCALRIVVFEAYGKQLSDDKYDKFWWKYFAYSVWIFLAATEIAVGGTDYCGKTRHNAVIYRRTLRSGGPVVTRCIGTKPRRPVRHRPQGWGLLVTPFPQPDSRFLLPISCRRHSDRQSMSITMCRTLPPIAEWRPYCLYIKRLIFKRVLSHAERLAIYSNCLFNTTLETTFLNCKFISVMYVHVTYI